MIKISLNHNYDSKKEKDANHSKVSQGWELVECEWDLEKIVELITKNGISGNEYSNGHRISDNWKSTYAIMLDFDDGSMTIDKLLIQQKSWKYNSYIFSSQNHQKSKTDGKGNIIPACDRLRALIPLDEPISNEYDRIAVEKALITQFQKIGINIDASFMKRTRYFAHGTTIVSKFVGNIGPMKWREIPELYGKPEKKRGRPLKSDKNNFTFRLNDKVKDGNGKMVLIKNLEPDTPIFCPVCGDAEYRTNASHNAVLLLNDSGIPFIFCSSCQSRNMGMSGTGVYNIHSDDLYQLKADEKEAVAFIDVITSQYYGGCVEKGSDEFVIRQLRSQHFVEQFCKRNGLPIPETFPAARYEFKFDKNDIINLDGGYINMYNAPDVLTMPVPENYQATMPKYIGLTIDHVLAHDKQIMDHFIHFLAVMVQHRRKMITSFLFQGTEGTGKGLLFTEILSQIFGPRYCTSVDQDEFGKEFNSSWSKYVLMLVNEVSADFGENRYRQVSVADKIKQAITDIDITIEGKGVNREKGTNVCTFLFATNQHHGVILGKGDRRFNVAPYQDNKIHDQKWWPGYKQLKNLIADELQEFVWYLKQYQIDENKISKVIDNDPKRKLQMLSKTNTEEFFDAVKAGDTSWLKDNLIKKHGYNDSERYDEVSIIINKLPNKKGITTNDLTKIYNYFFGKSESTISLGRKASSYLSPAKTIRINGVNKTGWIIVFK